MKLPEGAQAWLLIDVDGVLNVYDHAARVNPDLVHLNARGYRLNIHPWVGGAMAQMRGFALGWATTWESDVDPFGITEFRVAIDDVVHDTEPRILLVAHPFVPEGETE